MQRNTALADRIREVFLNGTWIANTNFKQQLENTNWEVALRKLENVNSIAALVFHINYYLGGLIRAFESGKLDISDQYSYDLPPIKHQQDWEQLINRFLKNAGEFAQRVSQMDDALLDKPFIDPKYGTMLRNIEGVIEHAYYHLGQVVILRKILEAG